MARNTDDIVILEGTEMAKSMRKVSQAHDELLERLFGFVPDVPGEYTTTRAQYARAMREIQKAYGLTAGNPELALFVLEQLSRSPKFKEEDTNGTSQEK